jgi:UDP-glucose 4-epimerase
MKRGNALVTGAFGFLGRHVSRACAQAGYSVRGIGHGLWARAEWSDWGLSEWQASDVTPEAMELHAGEPTLIVHCAGSGSVGFSILNPAQDFDRTVGTTCSVLDYMRLHCPQARLVLPSSASVYGNALTMPISLTAPLGPVSPYGVHKRMAEELCLSYAQHFGTSVAIVRLFSVHGVGLRKQLLWDACIKLSRGPATFSGTGRDMRDWLHVDDAAKLLVAVGQAGSSSPMVINGGTGVGVPTVRIVETIASAFGRDADVQFSGAARPGDPLHLIADMSGTDVLGWRPERTLSLELERYVKWFKAGAP